MFIALDISLIQIRGSQSLVYIADDMRPVLQVHRHLDHVDTHGHHVPARGAVVPGPGVALEGIGQVSTRKLVHDL